MDHIQSTNPKTRSKPSKRDVKLKIILSRKNWNIFFWKRMIFSLEEIFLIVRSADAQSNILDRKK